MPKTHYDPALYCQPGQHALTNSTPLHGTTYSGGVNGIMATQHTEDVDCAICLRKMRSPEMIGKFTTDELAP